MVCALLVASMVVNPLAFGANLYLYPKADPMPRYAPKARGVTTFPKRIYRKCRHLVLSPSGVNWSALGGPHPPVCFADSL